MGRTETLINSIINLVLIVLLAINILDMHVYHREIDDRLVNLENMIREDVTDEGIIKARYLSKIKR